MPLTHHGKSIIYDCKISHQETTDIVHCKTYYHTITVRSLENVCHTWAP